MSTKQAGVDPAKFADALDDLTTFLANTKRQWDRLDRGRSLIEAYMKEMGETYVGTAFSMFSEGLADSLDEVEKAGGFDDADKTASVTVPESKPVQGLPF